MPDVKLGQLAGRNEWFCPFAAVNKWPYRHLYGDASEKVSQEFFAAGRFRSRGWSVYYIRALLEDTATKPLLLIPQPEVEALFKEVWETFGIYAAFPDVTLYPGFEMGFREDGSPRPHYLGRLTDQTSLDDLEKLIPERGVAPEEPEILDDRSFPAFRRKMEAAIQAGKNKSKVVRAKKRRERVVTKRGWCAQLKRSQCYLGIRPRGMVSKEDFHNDPNQTYEQSKAAQAAYEMAAGFKLPKLLLDWPAPYPFDQNVVFVSVDVESYEKDHKKVTEIGVSTLDMLDLVKTPPGKGGIEWMKLIRSRHFRIVEYVHLRNTEFVVGCADQFQEKFGISEWISIKEAPQVVASCFRPPFSAPDQYTPHPADPNVVPRGGEAPRRYLTIANDDQPKRNIVLVGHDIRSDVEYLRSIGYDVSNLSNLLEAIDTADLFRAWKHEQSSRNLGTVLLELELSGWNLHNAGNDAAYTLQSLIGISFAALNTTHSPTPDPEELDSAARDARDRVIESAEEWEIADEEGGDGGEAVKILRAGEAADKRSFEKAMAKGRKADEAKERKRYSNKKITTKGDMDWEAAQSNRFEWDESAIGSQEWGTQQLPPPDERVGETKFHAVNEAAMRDMAATKDNGDAKKENAIPPHLRGMPKVEPKHLLNGNIGGSKNVGHDDVEQSIEPLSARMAARLTSVFDDDDDDFGGGGVRL